MRDRPSGIDPFGGLCYSVPDTRPAVFDFSCTECYHPHG